MTKRRPFVGPEPEWPVSARQHNYYVYIMTNASRTFYVGITNDLARRVWQHKTGDTPGFTEKYNVHLLVYYEETSRIDDAIAREKQLKDWRRAKKIRLIEAANPRWLDLSNGWYDG